MSTGTTEKSLQSLLSGKTHGPTIGARGAVAPLPPSPSELSYPSWLMPTFLCSVNFFYVLLIDSTTVITETVVSSLKLIANPRYWANCGHGQLLGLKFSRTLHAILTTAPLNNNVRHGLDVPLINMTMQVTFCFRV